jgi:nicotinamidase-related amidase
MDKKKVLFLIDVQNDFITGALRNEEAIKAVPNIVNKIKDEHWDLIILTKDTHFDDYLETREGKKLKVPHCIRGTYGWEIEHSVMDAVKESGVPYRFFPKHTFGCFNLSDGLEGVTDDLNISLVDGSDYFEFCGFCTDICVISNVLIMKASWYDWADFVVDPACCAGTTIEKHKAALAVMNSCQIDIKNYEENRQF